MRCHQPYSSTTPCIGCTHGNGLKIAAENSEKVHFSLRDCDFCCVDVRLAVHNALDGNVFTMTILPNVTIRAA